MGRMRGWGLLLAVAVPLLIFFSWSRLGSETSRINLERYEAWQARDLAQLLQPLQAHYTQNRRLAAAGDVALPAIPPRNGVKRWTLQADTTLLVELDAKLEGRVVQLRYVPVLRAGGHLLYDCVPNAALMQLARICRPEVIRSAADVATQLEANTHAQATLYATGSASVTSVPPAGVPTGSVVQVPAMAQDLNRCGFQCVQPQTCVTPRPLACAALVDEGNSRRQEIAATPTDYRGSSLATRAEADAVCAQALGAGYRVVEAASLSGVVRLGGGMEYWVHNPLNPAANCWSGS